MADNGVNQHTQAELLAMIAELQAEIRKVAEQSSKNIADNGSSKKGTDPASIAPPKEKLTLDNPFSQEVMSVQMPENFMLPTGLKPYEGIGDPRVHIKKFQSMIFFNGSISSFEDLARSFIDYFATSRIYVHGSDYLSTIKQGQHESLKDYMTRFAKATVEIPDLDPNVHLHTLKSSLRPGKFQETIAVTKPKTLEEFREKAAGQMEIEELREARKTDKPQTRREDERHNRTPNQKDSRKPFKLTPKYDTYTQFNTKTEDIIKEILSTKIIKPPSRAGAYQDQRYVDRSKHCAFHQKFGHTTDECVIAKDLLEWLARQGHLDKYIGSRMKSARQNINDPQTSTTNQRSHKLHLRRIYRRRTHKLGQKA
ncbi:uncharacterized protein LOC107641281 [Arachis ipaensis]|uniref:uncharacterized protein LOC107641281 n=1 Tax=Arachis ipaensis TaxID=130454 RepID=UPI0007AFA51F|nr:uncharacterized protein LOC107641281 [Arachis ipaensis]